MLPTARWSWCTVPRLFLPFNQTETWRRQAQVVEYVARHPQISLLTNRSWCPSFYVETNIDAGCSARLLFSWTCRGFKSWPMFLFGGSSLSLAIPPLKCSTFLGARSCIGNVDIKVNITWILTHCLPSLYLQVPCSHLFRNWLSTVMRCSRSTRLTSMGVREWAPRASHVIECRCLLKILEGNQCRRNI